MTEQTAATPTGVTTGDGQNVTVSNETGNTSFTLPNTAGVPQTPQGDAPARPELMDVIPDEYKDKDWLKKYTNVDDFFKGMDSAQEMVGKRPAGIPQESAPPEEWDEFYTQLGRPKTAEEYKIEYGSDLPEGITINEQQKAEFQQLAHKMGLTQKQVEQLATYDVESKKQMLAAMQPDTAKIDQEFDDFAKKTFGDREEEALASANKLLLKYAPEEMHDHLQSLDNKSLIALTSVLDAVQRNYINEGDTHTGGDVSSPQTNDALLKEAHDLMRSDSYKQPFHVDHAMTRRRVEEIYNKLYGQK